MYLQRHGSQKSAYKAKNIVFYALWVLYALSAVTSIVEILDISVSVSMDNHGCLISFQLLVRNIVVNHRVLGIIQITVFACCDFIAQFILVRTFGNAHHLLIL